jgi:hypothetical protein
MIRAEALNHASLYPSNKTSSKTIVGFAGSRLIKSSSQIFSTD